MEIICRFLYNKTLSLLLIKMSINNTKKKQRRIDVYTIKNYIMADSLEQAYELKKKSRNNVIIGGNLWLKMGNRNILNAIDLSALPLHQIEEDEEGFRIGCMVTLRDLETHSGLNGYFGGLFREAVKHIVGVQFRNCATVGGSVFPRFGFSDVLTAFLACDSYVELYRGGRVPVNDFVKMPLDEDILTHIYIKKDGRKVSYQSFRMTETDFPSLTCSVICRGDVWEAVIGARPKRAALYSGEKLTCPENPEQRKQFAKNIAAMADYGTNMRGSAEYRQCLAEVLIERGIQVISKEETEGTPC